LSTGVLDSRDIREPECHILSLAYLPDGKTLAGAVQRGGGQGLVRLWNLAHGQGRTLCRFQHSSGTWNLDLSPDGKSLACPGDDDTVCIVELAGGKLIHRFKGHENEVTAVAVAPDGKTLISGSKDRTIRFWDVEKKRNTNVWKDTMVT
jgi:WD40 repeat protein